MRYPLIPLGFQITLFLLTLLFVGMLFIVSIGSNAVKLSDETSILREEKFASLALEEKIKGVSEQQRSATIWDAAVRKTLEGDEEWISSNLGVWMQEYFGHDENYVLNDQNQAIFSSGFGEIWSAEEYDFRSTLINPLVMELRGELAEMARNGSLFDETLASVEVWDIVQTGDQAAIISVVPIISDTDEDSPSVEKLYLHVAMKYLDREIAENSLLALGIQRPRFEIQEPSEESAKVPVKSRSGQTISWLTWVPQRPGEEVLWKILPGFLAIAFGFGLITLWISVHLVKISSSLQASEAQARLAVEDSENANKKAKSAEIEKLNFLSVVSHEIRTPLTVILGYAKIGKNLSRLPADRKLSEALQGGDDTLKEVKVHLDKLLDISTRGMEKIEKSGEHILFLVNQILDYSKIKKGHLQVDRKACDIFDVVSPVIDQMRVLAEQKGLELNCNVPSCMVFTDLLRTRQILFNIIGNAIKFTDQGKVDVSFEERKFHVNVVIQDTGVGIEKSEVARIFESFYQSKYTSKKSVEGTGLGLTVAKDLAKLNGGDVTVKSEVKIGSTFTVSILKSK
ncbi:sensor histidine kinase [Roseovarius sp. CH_XMU1461]|uniref:sensor histidine kinase n=1 Tax=Roseovarius sp. CH_XMU1461 TaxID=3107777 RepID=UPI00300A966C